MTCRTQRSSDAVGAAERNVTCQPATFQVWVSRGSLNGMFQLKDGVPVFGRTRLCSDRLPPSCNSRANLSSLDAHFVSGVKSRPLGHLFLLCSAAPHQASLL